MTLVAEPILDTSWPAYESFMRQLFAIVDYDPTEAQWPFHLDTSRVRLVGGGERGGKSMSTAMDGWARSHLTMDGQPGKYWITGPDYLQPRKEFDYIREAYEKLGRKIERLSMPVSIASPWYLELDDGTTWETKTSSDVRKLASEAPDGIMMAEAAQQTNEVFLKLRGRVAERRGWLILSGTFEEGLPWYGQYFRQWQAPNLMDAKSFSLPSWSNRVLYPGGRDDPEIKALEATYPHDLFMERFGAVPMRPVGLVFKEFEYSTHVSAEVTYDNSLPVYLAIDPGYTGAYAVLALQVAGSHIHVVDEVYMRYGTVSEVIAECKERPWWGSVLTRSSGKTGGVIDIAGAQHHGMPSHVEVWSGQADIALKFQPVSIEDGIMVVRSALKNIHTGLPTLFFAPHLSKELDFEDHPTGILGEFEHYRYPTRSHNQNTTDKPIDKYNHALKALGYWLYDHAGPVLQRKNVYPKAKKRSYWT